MQRVALTVAIALALTAAAGAASVRIIQTNSAGTTVHLIDPATNKVVGVINGIEVNHGRPRHQTARSSTSATRPKRRSTSSTPRR